MTLSATGKPTTRNYIHDSMHVVIHYVASNAIVNGIDNIVIP